MIPDDAKADAAASVLINLRMQHRATAGRILHDLRALRENGLAILQWAEPAGQQGAALLFLEQLDEQVAEAFDDYTRANSPH